MRRVFTVLILIVLSLLIPIPFQLLYEVNHIRNVQQDNMVIDGKSIIASIIILILMVTVSYYLVIKNKTPTDAFIVGFIISAFSEFSNCALFQAWPLHLAVLNSFVGGSIFGIIIFIYSLLDKRQ
jgi:uncharacterized membrane protein AbrB (regulator of aidB expression)